VCKSGGLSIEGLLKNKREILKSILACKSVDEPSLRARIGWVKDTKNQTTRSQESPIFYPFEYK